MRVSMVSALGFAITVIHEVTHAFFDDKTETETARFADTLSRLLFNNLQFKNHNLQQLIKD